MSRNELKRKCQRENYRVVGEMKNNGIIQYLVEFKLPLFTLDTFGLPKINLFGRWKLCVEWISPHRQIIEGLRKNGRIKVIKDTKEECYKFISQEMERQGLEYGNLIKARKTIY